MLFEGWEGAQQVNTLNEAMGTARVKVGKKSLLRSCAVTMACEWSLQHVWGTGSHQPGE